MIKQVDFNNRLGETLTIKLPQIEPTHGLFLTGIDGLGLVKVDNNMSKIATRHGSRYNSSRANSRDITFHLRYLDTPSASAEDARDLTYRMFPVGGDVVMKFTTANRTAVTHGYVEENEPDIFDEEAGATITVNCPYPWMYLAGAAGTQSESFSDMEAAFEFPVDDNWDGDLEFDPFTDESATPYPNPAEIFTILNLNGEHTIYYRGEWETGMDMTIDINGKFSGLTIHNRTLSQEFVVDTTIMEQILADHYKADIFNISAGDQIIINSRTDQKKIQYYVHTNGDYINIIGAVSIDSDWPTLSPGSNTFVYLCESGDYNLGITIEATVFVQGV